jgi:hypothetical protein
MREAITQSETEPAISTEAVAFRERVNVRDSTMAYVDTSAPRHIDDESCEERWRSRYSVW